MGTAVNRPDRETTRLNRIRRLVMRGTNPPFPQRDHGMVLNYTQTALCCYLHFQNKVTRGFVTWWVSSSADTLPTFWWTDLQTEGKGRFTCTLIVIADWWTEQKDTPLLTHSRPVRQHRPMVFRCHLGHPAYGMPDTPIGRHISTRHCCR